MSPSKGEAPAETRTVKVLAVGGAVRLGFPGLAQIARIRRWTRDQTTGEVSHHVMFYLTSRDERALRPAEFAEAIRSHWQVESWHWTRDVVFSEDRATATAGSLVANLASLRAAAIAILGRLGRVKVKGGNDVTAWRDRISSQAYTAPLAILGIADIKQQFQVCLSRESRGPYHRDNITLIVSHLAGQVPPPTPRRRRLNQPAKTREAAHDQRRHVSYTTEKPDS